MPRVVSLYQLLIIMNPINATVILLFPTVVGIRWLQKPVNRIMLLKPQVVSCYQLLTRMHQINQSGVLRCPILIKMQILALCWILSSQVSSVEVLIIFCLQYAQGFLCTGCYSVPILTTNFLNVSSQVITFAAE
ncbi:uncharacterized protein LOC135149939 isoform X2 [Daucus carota subsp. sativus]|uniref:uncharacterized protein LOC135149939 isoform X2 n=1 Tax=Daucus carota subsp. sativus TaxID=79200 RepID=UPI003082F7B7